MDALIHAGWVIWLWLSIGLVFDLVGLRGLVQMFPEGKKWWLLPVQIASLAFFALAVLFNPWSVVFVCK